MKKRAKPFLHSLVYSLPFLFPGLSGVAQTNYTRMVGVIRDKTGQTLQAVTVLLRRQKDSMVVRSSVTDKEGNFTIDRVTAGNYFLAATSVGYENYSGGPIGLDSTIRLMVIPDITMLAAFNELKAAMVVKQKPMVEWKIDKLVVNVATSPFFTPGQSGVDVLERSPGVTIDYLNNSISLNGRPGTMIYINGRLSYLSGPDLVNYLRGLPAGSIEQVEVISQPSSRYDAAGSGGVINIILKKDQAGGIYGSLTASGIIGFYLKTRDNFQLNWRQDRLNLNFTYGIADNKTFNDQQIRASFRTAYGVAFSQYQDYQVSTISSTLSHTPRLALDYQANGNTSLGLNLTGLFTSSSSVTNGPINLYDSLHDLLRQQASTNGNNNPVSNFGINFNLQQKLNKKGKELSADGDYLFYRSPGSQASYNYTYDSNGNAQASLLLSGYLPTYIDIYAFKTDYSQPLHFSGTGKSDGKEEEDGKLEAGIKSSYVRTNNNAQYSVYDTAQKKWQPDAALTDHFIYSENINSVYVNLSKQLNKKWGVQIGARAEQTISRGNETIQQIRFSRDYIRVFPTVYISYAPNVIHSFTFSYGSRMERPSYQDLNPFQYVINQFNIRKGNPTLQPDHINNFELAYHYKSEFTVWADYIKFDNIFSKVYKTTGQGEDLITIQTKENIASRQNIFIFFFYTKALAKWWNTNWTVALTDARIDDPADAGNPIDHIIVCRFDLNNQFPLGKGWGTDLRGTYVTRRLEGAHIYNLASGYFSPGINKKVMKNKGTLTANVNDPFRLFKPGQTSEAATFFNTTTDRPETRYLSITFNYRFGKQKQNQKRKIDGSAEDEQRRVNF